MYINQAIKETEEIIDNYQYNCDELKKKIPLEKYRHPIDQESLQFAITHTENQINALKMILESAKEFHNLAHTYPNFGVVSIANKWLSKDQAKNTGIKVEKEDKHGR